MFDIDNTLIDGECSPTLADVDQDRLPIEMRAKCEAYGTAAHQQQSAPIQHVRLMVDHDERRVVHTLYLKIQP